MGEFYPKTVHAAPSYAYKKWPVSNPGQHGFVDFHSTEASAATSVLNCGCEPSWKQEGEGCIVGGGDWTNNRSFDCENYWSPTDVQRGVDVEASCRSCSTASRECVQNLTNKITGDDTAHIVDTFESFLDDHGYLEGNSVPGDGEDSVGEAAETPAPFLAVLWLHTVHEPHAALPEFYHNYTDAFGDPARDYLGSLTQMDVQIGRLRQVLRRRGIANNTMLWCARAATGASHSAFSVHDCALFPHAVAWCCRLLLRPLIVPCLHCTNRFTSDNGPHPATETTGARDRSADPAFAATSGLRQCKASLYEGGIRVPGLLEWPAMVKRNVRTWHPSYVSDYLPTLLDVIGRAHPQPTWAADGMSLLPLIGRLGRGGATNDTSARPSSHPLVFKLKDQVAIIDNDVKILENPAAGLCAAQGGSVFKGTRMFNLSADPTESHDVSQAPAYAALFHNLSARLASFKASLLDSAVNESGCMDPKRPLGDAWPAEAHVGWDGIQPQCRTPFGPATPPRPPPPPPSPAFALRTEGGGCLAANISWPWSAHPSRWSDATRAARLSFGVFRRTTSCGLPPRVLQTKRCA